MKLTLQRVANASVTVDGSVVSSISNGLVCFVGIDPNSIPISSGRDDTIQDAEWATKKLLNVRLWPNENGKQWGSSVISNSFQVLLISQFTLHGYLYKNKPTFHLSMSPSPAKELYDKFVQLVNEAYPKEGKVTTGVFGAYMHVSMVNDGPVTLNLDSKKDNKNNLNTDA